MAVTLDRRALRRAAALVLVIATAVVPTATHPDPALVIWHEGPGTSGRGPDQVHYVICVPAADPVDGPLTEVLIDPAEAYPVPDLVTGRHRFSQGQPCPDGPART
ncbi:hypothetical protein [Umezawaea tangerina]|uniref:Secreted protein n=1 Tax=Umezawaea tangerina TaxID=84725 RepID=A0A2T0SPI9_9PSEU|nr:hypothetical protein [Umezawaea tangerina]PRY35325.1 hypothetical protein CLV43_114243 [Umezawaea tangerina]